MDAFEKWWRDQHQRDSWTPFEAGEAAFRAGMRAAGAMCLDADKSTHPTDLGNAILAEADK